MATKRILTGIIIVAGTLFFVGPLLLEQLVTCERSLIAARPSPSGKLAARHYRSVQCDDLQQVPESQVFVGEAKRGRLGARVLAVPYERIDKASGNQRPTDIQLVWRGEDFLQIYYPRDVFPRDTHSRVIVNGFEVRIDSRYIEVPSNNSMQPTGQKRPAADRER